jgi:hypothetical protein
VPGAQVSSIGLHQGTCQLLFIAWSGFQQVFEVRTHADHSILITRAREKTFKCNYGRAKSTVKRPLNSAFSE